MAFERFPFFSFRVTIERITGHQVGLLMLQSWAKSAKRRWMLFLSKMGGSTATYSPLLRSPLILAVKTSIKAGLIQW
jgi:hypothetical protein